MSGYLLKAAGRDATYAIDWRRGYLAEGETLAADLGWTIHAGRADGLAVAEHRLDGCRSEARFAGGVAGRFYMVSTRVRTSRGRVLERSIVVRIALERGPH